MKKNDGFNNSLFAICQAMVSSLDLEEVLSTILDLSVKTFRANTGSILLYEGSDRLRMLASRGLPEEVVKRGHISRKGSPAEWVIDHNEPRIFNGAVDGGATKLDTIEKTDSIRSALCVPLRAKGRVIGTLNLNRRGADATEFNQDDLNTLMIMASQAAICIENARLYDENMRQARLAAIGQTVAGLSHCIKNMLSGLRGGVGLMELAKQASDWETQTKGMSILRRSVDRISYLVLDMLDYSREKTPMRRPTSADHLINEVYETVNYKASQKGVTLRREVADGLGTILVDPDQLFRCLLNLVENAIDAVVPGDKATILTRCNKVSPIEAKIAYGEDIEIDNLGKIIEISVIDNGMGIDKEHFESIFQPFFSTKASKGTGLGLAVTKKLVEEHGGKITLESEPGRGTAFHMILPENPAPRPAPLDTPSV